MRDNYRANSLKDFTRHMADDLLSIERDIIESRVLDFDTDVSIHDQNRIRTINDRGLTSLMS